MALEIVGFVLVFSHLVTVGLIVLWFSSGKPNSMAEFRANVFGQASKTKKHPELPAKL